MPAPAGPAGVGKLYVNREIDLGATLPRKNCLCDTTFFFRIVYTHKMLASRLFRPAAQLPNVSEGRIVLPMASLTMTYSMRVAMPLRRPSRAAAALSYTALSARLPLVVATMPLPGRRTPRPRPKSLEMLRRQRRRQSAAGLRRRSSAEEVSGFRGCLDIRG